MYRGELAIVRAREKADKTLGAKFNIRASHDAVLELGSVPMPIRRAGGDGEHRLSFEVRIKQLEDVSLADPVGACTTSFPCCNARFSEVKSGRELPVWFIKQLRYHNQ
jgi:Bacterial protein of unknown function (DUF885)